MIVILSDINCRLEATGIVLFIPLLDWADGKWLCCVGVFRLELAMATIVVPQELIASTLTSI